MCTNANLHKAKAEKDDEFYTRYDDIENELAYYKDHLKGKVIYCNCDNPEWSNFWRYFKDNFEELKIKKLISTYYEKDDVSYKLEYDGVEDVQTALIGNGDFRSKECIGILKDADIVITNPPFSLFREYISLLIEYKKKFLIIGSKNSITYKEVFPSLMNGDVWLGYTRPNKFITPSGKETNKLQGISRWFTNLGARKEQNYIQLKKKYIGNENRYPKYDNFNAIEVGKVIDIPSDYDGIMGVPITFLDNCNPKQFVIIGNEYSLNIARGRGYVSGKRMYSRIFIKAV